jgi:hypothetical protein
MDTCFFLIVTLIAHRMGARGGWLFFVFLFSWLGIFIWLVAGREPQQERKREGLREAAERKREAAELERTLMIVRAMNPVLADEIVEQKTYERLAPLMSSRPLPKPKARCSKLCVATVAGCLVFLGFFMSHAPAPNTSSQCGPQCQDENLRRKLELGMRLNPPPGHALSDAEIKDAAADAVEHLHGLGRGE